MDRFSSALFSSAYSSEYKVTDSELNIHVIRNGGSKFVTNDRSIWL